MRGSEGKTNSSQSRLWGIDGRDLPYSPHSNRARIIAWSPVIPIARQPLTASIANPAFTPIGPILGAYSALRRTASARSPFIRMSNTLPAISMRVASAPRNSGLGPPQAKRTDNGINRHIPLASPEVVNRRLPTTSPLLLFTCGHMFLPNHQSRSCPFKEFNRKNCLLPSPAR